MSVAADPDVAARAGCVVISYAGDSDRIWPWLESGLYSLFPLPLTEWQPPSSETCYVLPQLHCSLLPSNHPSLAYPRLPLNWYRDPFLHIFLVQCETVEAYKLKRVEIREWVDARIAEEQQWLVLYCPMGTRSRFNGLGSAFAAAVSGVSGVRFSKGTSLQNATYARIHERLQNECVPRKEAHRVVRSDSHETWKRAHQASLRARAAARTRELAGQQSTSPSQAAQDPEIPPAAAQEAKRKGLSVFSRKKADTQDAAAPDAAAATALADFEDWEPLPDEDKQEIELQWAYLKRVIHSLVYDALYARVQRYEVEIRKRFDQRYVPGWNFSDYFCICESLAFVYTQMRLPQEALRIYQACEYTFLAVASVPNSAVSWSVGPVPQTSSGSSSSEATAASHTSSSASTASTSAAAAVSPVLPPLAQSGYTVVAAASAAVTLGTLGQCMRTAPGLSDRPMLADYPAQLLAAVQPKGVGSSPAVPPAAPASSSSSTASASRYPPSAWSRLSPEHPPPHLLDINSKPFRQLLYAAELSLFDFKWYLFAREASLLLQMRQIAEFADLARTFIQTTQDMATVHITAGSLDPAAARAFLFCACMDVLEVCTRHGRRGTGRVGASSSTGTGAPGSSSRGRARSHSGAGAGSLTSPGGRSATSAGAGRASPPALPSLAEAPGEVVAEGARRQESRKLLKSRSQRNPDSRVGEGDDVHRDQQQDASTEGPRGSPFRPVSSSDASAEADAEGSAGTAGSPVAALQHTARHTITDEDAGSEGSADDEDEGESEADEAAEQDEDGGSDDELKLTLGDGSELGHNVAGGFSPSIRHSPLARKLHGTGPHRAGHASPALGRAVTPGLLDEAGGLAIGLTRDEYAAAGGDVTEVTHAASLANAVSGLAAAADVTDDDGKAGEKGEKADAGGARPSTPAKAAHGSASLPNTPASAGENGSDSQGRDNQAAATAGNIETAPAAAPSGGTAAVPSPATGVASPSPAAHDAYPGSHANTLYSPELSYRMSYFLTVARKALHSLLDGRRTHPAWPQVLSLTAAPLTGTAPDTARRGRAGTLLVTMHRTASSSGGGSTLSIASAQSPFELAFAAAAGHTPSHTAAATALQGAHSAVGLALAYVLSTGGALDCDRLYASVLYLSSVHNHAAGRARAGLCDDVERAALLMSYGEWHAAVPLLTAQCGRFALEGWHSMFATCLWLLLTAFCSTARHSEAVRVAADLLDPRLQPYGIPAYATFKQHSASGLLQLTSSVPAVSERIIRASQLFVPAAVLPHMPGEEAYPGQGDLLKLADTMSAHLMQRFAYSARFLAPPGAASEARVLPQSVSFHPVHLLMRPLCTSCVTMVGPERIAVAAPSTAAALAQLLAPRLPIAGQEMQVTVHISCAAGAPLLADAVSVVLTRVRRTNGDEQEAEDSSRIQPGAYPFPCEQVPPYPVNAHGADPAVLAAHPDAWVPIGPARALPPLRSIIEPGVQQFAHGSAGQWTGRRAAAAQALLTAPDVSGHDRAARQGGTKVRRRPVVCFYTGSGNSSASWSTSPATEAAHTPHDDELLISTAERSFTVVHRPSNGDLPAGCTSGPAAPGAQVLLHSGMVSLTFTMPAPSQAGNYAVSSVQVRVAGGGLVLRDPAPLFIGGYSLPQLVACAKVADAAAKTNNASVTPVPEAASAGKKAKRRRTDEKGRPLDELHFTSDKLFPRLKMRRSRAVAALFAAVHAAQPATTAPQPLLSSPRALAAEAPAAAYRGRSVSVAPGATHNTFTSPRATSTPATSRDSEADRVARAVTKPLLPFAGPQPSPRPALRMFPILDAHPQLHTTEAPPYWMHLLRGLRCVPLTATSTSAARSGTAAPSRRPPVVFATTVTAHPEAVQQPWRGLYDSNDVALGPSVAAGRNYASAGVTNSSGSGGRNIEAGTGIGDGTLLWHADRAVCDYIPLEHPHDADAAHWAALGSQLLAAPLPPASVRQHWFYELESAFAPDHPIRVRPAAGHVWFRARAASDATRASATPSLDAATAAAAATTTTTPTSQVPRLLPILYGCRTALSILVTPGAGAGPAGLQSVRLALDVPASLRIAAPPAAWQLDSAAVMGGTSDAEAEALSAFPTVAVTFSVNATGSSSGSRDGLPPPTPAPLDKSGLSILPPSADAVHAELQLGPVAHGKYVLIRLPVIARPHKRAAASGNSAATNAAQALAGLRMLMNAAAGGGGTAGGTQLLPGLPGATAGTPGCDLSFVPAIDPSQPVDVSSASLPPAYAAPAQMAIAGAAPPVGTGSVFNPPLSHIIRVGVTASMTAASVLTTDGVPTSTAVYSLRDPAIPLPVYHAMTLSTQVLPRRIVRTNADGITRSTTSKGAVGPQASVKELFSLQRSGDGLPLLTRKLMNADGTELTTITGRQPALPSEGTQLVGGDSATKIVAPTPNDALFNAARVTVTHLSAADLLTGSGLAAPVDKGLLLEADGGIAGDAGSEGTHERQRSRIPSFALSETGESSSAAAHDAAVLGQPMVRRRSGVHLLSPAAAALSVNDLSMTTRRPSRNSLVAHHDRSFSMGSSADEGTLRHGTSRKARPLSGTASAAVVAVAAAPSVAGPYGLRRFAGDGFVDAVDDADMVPPQSAGEFGGTGSRTPAGFASPRLLPAADGNALSMSALMHGLSKGVTVGPLSSASGPGSLGGFPAPEPNTPSRDVPPATAALPQQRVARALHGRGSVISVDATGLADGTSVSGGSGLGEDEGDAEGEGEVVSVVDADQEELYSVVAGTDDLAGAEEGDEDEEDEDEDEEGAGNEEEGGGAVWVQHCAVVYLPYPIVLRGYSMNPPTTSGWILAADGSRNLVGMRLDGPAVRPDPRDSVRDILVAAFQHTLQEAGPHAALVEGAHDVWNALRAPRDPQPYLVTFAYKFNRSISASTSVVARFSCEWLAHSHALGRALPPSALPQYNNGPPADLPDAVADACTISEDLQLAVVK